MCTLFLKISKISYSQSNIQRNLSLEIKYYLLTCRLYLYYISLYYNIIFNDVFFRFRPPFVSSPVSRVISIGNIMANQETKWFIWPPCSNFFTEQNSTNRKKLQMCVTKLQELLQEQINCIVLYCIASTRALLKLASSVRALLKPYGDTLSCVHNFDDQSSSYRSSYFNILNLILQVQHQWHLEAQLNLLATNKTEQLGKKFYNYIKQAPVVKGSLS